MPTIHRRWFSLLPFVLGIFLLAGSLCLLAPPVAQAEEATTPPALIADTIDNMLDKPIEITFEDDPNWRAAINTVYVDDVELDASEYTKDTAGKIIFSEDVFDTEKDYDVVIKADGYLDVSVTQKIERVELEVKGDGVTTPKEYTMSHLQGMEQYRYLYSTINTYPTKNWYVAEGVKLRELLEEAGIRDEAKQVRFTSHDGFMVTFTVQELLNDDRSLFPNFKENHEYFGYIPGSSEGAEKVETILALRSDGSDDFDNMSSKDALHLIFGQRALTEQTNAVFAKSVAKVEVITAVPVKWAAPTANINSGEVPAGTLVKLDGPNNDTDKVHYTLDGSEPTVDSPMYNWIAQRWSSRPDFDEINHPIEITNDTTIKAAVIGPGKEDSDVVEFNYMVDGPDPIPVTNVSITEGDQELEEGQTVQLTAEVVPGDATNKNVTWSSGDETVATVSETGLVTAVAEGMATITVTTDDRNFTDSITVTVVSAVSTIDVLYDGEVALTSGETFTVTAYNSGLNYTVNKTTPLGALQAAAAAGGFTYGVTDKNYEASGALLLDNVGNYNRKDPGYWYAYVNDVYKDGYNNAAGALNLIELVDGDRVEFYYAADVTDGTDLNAVKAAATAAVKTVVDTDAATPTIWTLQLSGAKDATVTKAEFEEGLACQASGHQVSWTDDDGNVWGGVPLWLLVAMVDDDPDVGSHHFNFNDDLAVQNYEVNVIAGDGWKTTLDSAAIAHNDGYIVANTLNGEPLPVKTEGGKNCWPLYLKGSAVFGGQQVGNIVRIELSGLPEPPAGWTLEMIGDVGDTITQEEFEEGLACTGSGHYKEWTDNEGNVWSGVPLWVLLGTVDDIESSGHWTFNDEVANDGYSVQVVAGDGFPKPLPARM